MEFDYEVMPAILLLLAALLIVVSFRRFRNLSAKPYPSRRKLVERIALSLIILIAAATAGSSLFNTIAQHLFWAHNPPPGQILTVNGHKMHISCTGQGQPTIILDAGLGSDSFHWGGIQPALSTITRVCSYDRAGFGWSDPLPAPRDADHIAHELHQLVLQASITGPIVLMGHSIAGIYMRDYAMRYPSGLAGLVFVDASTPLQDENPAMKSANSSGPPSWVFRSALIAGIPRLIGMCSKPAKGMDPDAGRQQAEDVCRVHYTAITNELDSFNQSGHQTVHSGPFGSLPILIFSHDPAKAIPTHSPADEVRRQQAWSQMQEDLKKLSTHSRRIIAQGSTHNVHRDRPDLVVKEVTLFIQQIRGAAHPPETNNSTLTE
jgi:pimeloyl-ACP methyl ester carboxylesterase